jgi:hypothetical protein
VDPGAAHRWTSIILDRAQMAAAVALSVSQVKAPAVEWVRVDTSCSRLMPTQSHGSERSTERRTNKSRMSRVELRATSGRAFRLAGPARTNLGLVLPCPGFSRSPGAWRRPVIREGMHGSACATSFRYYPAAIDRPPKGAPCRAALLELQGIHHLDIGPRLRRQGRSKPSFVIVSRKVAGVEEQIGYAEQLGRTFAYGTDALAAANRGGADPHVDNLTPPAL